jgi:hypothetical protein
MGKVGKGEKISKVTEIPSMLALKTWVSAIAF